jgi:superfamily II DNA helicase RecQ
VLNSSLSWEEASSVEQRLLAGDLDLLYIAPERLLTPRCLDLLARGQLARTRMAGVANNVVQFPMPLVSTLATP